MMQNNKEPTEFKIVTMQTNNKKNSSQKSNYLPLGHESNHILSIVDDEQILEEVKNNLDPISFKNIFIFLAYLTPTVLATFIYMFTLQGCYDTQARCLEKYPIRIVQYMILVIIFCSLLYVIQILLWIYKYTDYKQSVVMFTIVTFVCFLYDTGTDLQSHGAYNRIILMIFIVLWFSLVFMFLNIGYYLFRKPIITTCLIVLFLFLSYLKIHYMIKGSCDGWDVGFKGTTIQNPASSGCKITPPKICYYVIFEGYFDLSRLLGDRYDNMGSDNFENVSPNLSPNDPKQWILGYPRTEGWNIFPDSVYGKIQKKAMKEVVNMKDRTVPEFVKNRIEVTTDFTVEPPKVNIDIKVDQKLIEERRKLFKTKNTKDALVKNVLYLFIDSVSRNNFKHKLPKFYKWIEQFYNPE